MTTTTIPPELFAREVERRLIDTFELMLALGLRTRKAVWERVRAGTLPEPLIQSQNLAFWDRDALNLDGR